MASSLSPSSASAQSAALADALLSDAREYSSIHPNTARLTAGRGSVKDVNLPDVNMAIEGVELLSNATLRLIQGHRYGLVGRNGAGKSTLLRRIAAGQIGGFPPHLRCHLVQQEVPASDLTALQQLLASDTERTALLAQEAALLQAGDSEESEALVSVYERLAAIDSDGAEARAAEALGELGFSEEAQARSTLHLSGGWRMRAALAQAVYARADILLLDEPTNHLDLHGVLWLQRFLLSLDAVTCLLVSHDTAFLTAVTTDVIHFHLQALTYYPGNWDSFLEARANALANTQRQQLALDAHRQHIRNSIDKMKTQAKSTGHPEQRQGLIGSRQKKLGRMGLEKTADGKKFNAQKHGRRVGSENDAPISTDRKRHALSLIEPADHDFKFAFPPPCFDGIGEGAPLLSASRVGFGYGVDEGLVEELKRETRKWMGEVEEAELKGVVPPRPPRSPAQSPLIFADVSMTVRAGDVVGIVGLNGLGKSSLLKLLSGEVEASSGEVKVGSGVRVAHFHQHLVEQLDVRRTPVAELLSVAPLLATSANSEQQARAVLGRFGLGGSLALRPIGVLSGGQKARLMFAMLTLQAPQLLLLDEPTNHLDLVTCDALVQAVQSFAGAVLLVSHDQALLATCTQLHLVEERRPPAVIKLNPNQLKAKAERLQEQREKERRKAAKGKASASASSSTSSTPALSLPSRCTLTKLTESFDEYRQRVMDTLD